ncbi:MAG: hypothetical protein Q8O84_01915 [Nanoarchaeota archaeon]|nr:hypothetical protein [Nanoarchaeota archaeon]
MTEEIKYKCEACDRTFANADGLASHNSAKHSELVPKEKNPIPVKKIKNWAIGIIVIVIIAGLIFWGISSVKTLPPTDMQGHIEVSPESHILKEQMPLTIQKHMLEHADGSGPPGVVINYNCEDYICEEDLIKNLEGFAEKYPANVYVAPFKNMDAKIALTKLGKIEILENYDEERIRNFIIGF